MFVNSINRRFFRAILLGALTLAAVPAARAAAQDDGFVQRVVTTEGIDLTSQAGRVALRHRIVVASRMVCAEANNGIDFTDPDFRDCVRGAYATAWRQAETRIAAAKQMLTADR